jgi:pSer/pThr/pTyr-binding forkhead associated (FHA) protein
MSTALAAPRTGFKFMLTVRSGPDAGATFQLLPPKVTIGRGSENHVALSDPRVSRQAAVIEFSMEKIVVSDVSSRQAMRVNGQPTSGASIKDGDVIQLGDTELGFLVEALPLQPPVTMAPPPLSGPGQLHPLANFSPPSMANPGFDSAQMGYSPRPSGAATPAGADSGKGRFYLIVAVILGGLIWLLNSEEKEKTPEKGLKTVQQIEEEIKSSEQRREVAAKKREFRSNEERTRHEEAQRHYMEGFRDYQKGQYVRAMKSFETARAIDPGHELAGRYYRLAEKQRDEMIDYMILEGRRYKEKNMFSRCSSAFEKVLDAIPNKNHLKYKSAEALKRECDESLGGRFR